MADRELINPLRAVARGVVYVQPLASRLLAKGLTEADPHRIERVTLREPDVLRLTGQGHSAPEIVAKLFIGKKTLETYKQRINEKLGFTGRADCVQLALPLVLLAQL